MRIFMHCKNGLDQISVQLTYCDLDTEEICRFEEAFSFFLAGAMVSGYDGSLSEMDRFSVCMEKRSVRHPYRHWSFRFLTVRDSTNWWEMYTEPFTGKKILFIRHLPEPERRFPPLFPAIRAVGENLGGQNILSYGKDDHTNGGERIHATF